MRLVDVVNQVRRSASEGMNFVRYPVQMITYSLRRIGQRWYESAEFSSREKQDDRTTKTTVESTVEAPVAERSIVYTGIRPAFVPEASSATIEGLTPGTEIKSRWNVYTIGTCFAIDRNIRLYEGKTRSDEPVLIKEYRLLDYENLDELEKRQQAFERLIELNQKIGHGPDFRIVKLIDAIALFKERTCYLITKPINHNTTLETYLAQSDLMTAPQIREALRQVLESLRFLHTAYRVHFPAGETERGLPHGNLSLKSLLVRQVNGLGNGDRQFFIYLTDLELWEHLFHPLSSTKFHAAIAKSAQDLGSVQQDLADLGKIGLHLAGGTLTSTSEATQQITCELNDPPLLHFIQRLIGMIQPFNTAEEALHTLLKLPEPSQSVLSTSTEISLEETRQRDRKKLILAIALLALGLVGLAALLFRKSLTPSTVTLPNLSPAIRVPEPSRIASEDAPPSLTYVVEPQGAWHYAMARQFISNPDSGANILPENLIEAIENRHSKITIAPAQRVTQTRDVIGQLVNREADVAFMTQPDISLASQGLENQTVAHDALVVFVPFSDPYHFNQTPAQEINRSISIEELRQLYTSDLDTATNTVPFPGQSFRVKLFFSEDVQTVERFKSRILGNDAELRERFDRLRVKAMERDEAAARLDRAPNDVYNRIWADANQSEDQNVINIGFDRLGRMFDQCSVHPLAIREGEQTTQVLIRSNGDAIDSNIDLCGEKGSYLPNIQNYPLIYNLDLVYPKGSAAGVALARMLQTTEGQYLMSEVGLIPKQPIPQLLSAVWGETDD